MRTLSFALLLWLFANSFGTLFAQGGDIAAVNDTLCIELGENVNFKVTDNDILPPGAFLPVFLTTPSNCFNILEDGQLVILSDDERCCGEHLLEYRYEGCQSGPECIGLVFLAVKCPKPECFVVNLEDYAGQGSDPTGGGNPMDPGCVYACENSDATYFVGYDPSSTYNWSVTGGTFTTGATPAEIHVSWGPMGSGAISVAITGSSGETTVIEVCADILEAPVAAFQASATGVCLNSPVSFTNTSTGGNDFFWDFGDGNTSSLFEPTHQYSAPGTYTATLYVTRNNYDALGNPLCCCTDSTALDITVDSLEGPGIYWISTLCANDSTKYWTDAMNCATYNWTVLDENGMPIAFTGQGNDTIGVQWGAGPFGTVMLEVAGCDEAYCEEPVSVKVPIIPSTVGINGLTEVCENAIATYTVPKWASVYYNWQASGGAILSGQGSNTVVVQWGAAPGPGVLNLNYSSSFLSGLPGHETGDCAGTASLTVGIKPEFDITGPSPAVACTNSVSSFFATAAPSAAYTWTATPPATFSGQGTNAINVTWDSGPGIYTVTAKPNSPAVYCNDSVSVRVRVEELPPPDGIDGPTSICPGQAYTYFAQTSESSVGFSWSVTGGTLSSPTGNPVTVTWNAGGPYALALQQFQLNAPFCTSDPVSITVLPKLLNGPLAITGPPACTNSTQSYSAGPAQHPEAVFTWAVTPASLGSIINGQGTPNIQVQWNNDPGMASLSLTVELCGNMLSTTKNIPLVAPQAPAITQSGVLCPGVPATLSAGGGFSSYLWSTGATTSSISITTGGAYTVMATDAGGCQAVGSYTATALPGPVADISTPNNTTLCIAPPNSASVTMYAITNPGYTFQWYCNGAPQALPPTQATFTHNNTNVNGAFAYNVVVTDANGCTKTSNTITVVQTNNCTSTGGCTPQSYYLSTNAINQTPNCNVVNFYTFKTANVTVLSWNFGDPGNNINTGSLLFPVHAYTKAGYFTATVTAQAPEASPGAGFCTVTRTRSVSVPVAADFSFADSCQVVTFTDLSTFLPGNNITSWSWSFGDAGTSTAQNPTHTYLSPGAYNVTLTVGIAGGCQATIVKPVTVGGLPNPVITAAPSPACVGQPANFSGSGAGIIQWLWDFDDGATNGGQNPAHTYLSPGTYNVTLTGQDARGCENTVVQPILVYPAPPEDTIAYTPSLTICEGETVGLIAPSGAGYTYLWNNGSTAQLITVSSAGTYSVIVTDANGCTLMPDPVTVVVYPAPDAFITGSSVICDQGCTTLSAPAGFGYTYQWLDDAGLPIPFQTGQQLVACDAGLLPAYSVVVTDANGCSATSAPFTVTVEVAPSFTVDVMPDSCEGSPSILMVNPVQPGVTYAWSNGAAGPSVTVLQAGTYTAVGADTLTGCRGSASATIYPLPDLCLAPAGCYETCNPDTICGPDGLAAYQWNMNGVPIAGANGQCLIVTQSGAYSLTGTTDFGCELTSDTLILEVLECDCASLAVSAAATADSCCWSLSYDNTYSSSLLGLMIHSPDADLDFDLAGLDPALGVQTIGTHWIGLINGQANMPLPGGQLDDFLTFCMSNVQNSPQQVIIDWYDFDLQIVCSDTLEFNCPVEPDCLYLSADSIYCENGAATYELTVCNPTDAAFNVGYIDVLPAGPAGLVVSPPTIDISSSPIQPGECRTFTLLLSGAGIAGQDFCYNLVAHEADPQLAPDALCCSLDTLYCIPIPDCEPCDDIGVESVTAVSDDGNGNCCYDITLFNNYQPGAFDGIHLCMLSPGTAMTIDNPFGSGWVTNYYSPALIELDIAPPLGNSLPTGAFSLPEICLQTTEAPGQLLEVKWMQSGKVVCRDTIDLFCEPPCGYLFEEDILCNSAGGWTYNATLKNTSAFTMGEAHLSVTTPAGMGAYDQVIPLGALAPGGAFPISLLLGAPALAGDTVCITVALHELGSGDSHTNCCNFTQCFVLPDCSTQQDCLCDQSLSAIAAQGFSCLLDPATLTGTFAPAGGLTSCDAVAWFWGDNTPAGQTAGNGPISHTFPSAGPYTVCMNVVRTDITGNICEEAFCKDVDFGPVPPARLAPPVIYENPSDGAFTVELDPRLAGKARFRLFDINKQLVERWEAAGQVIPVDVRGIPSGLYLLIIEAEGERWVEKVVVQ